MGLHLRIHSTALSHLRLRASKACRAPALFRSQRQQISSFSAWRSCSTVEAFSTTKENPSPQVAAVLEARRRLRSLLQVETFHIAGVSFDERQAAVRALKRGQAVRFDREPDNEFDTNAVAVSTLSAASLGYVPRERTASLCQDTTFGHVVSVGPVIDNPDGLYGALVSVAPQLPALCVAAIPKALKDRLDRALADNDWQTVREAALTRAGNRCGVSGAQAELEVVPSWQLADGNGAATLIGAQALAPELAAAYAYFSLEWDDERQQAAWLLQAMNDWTVAEVQEYLRHASGIAKARTAREWSVDTSWAISGGMTE